LGRSKITYLAENTALGIRDYLGLQPLDPMDPYDLARRLPIRVIKLDSIPGLSAAALQYALGRGKDDWSAGTIDLPRGHYLIILNPTHSRLRRKSTLMEEICHVVLGHNPSCLGNGDNSIWFRSYDRNAEAEAYRVGAATLIPYDGLRELLRQRLDMNQIGRHYDVTTNLVEYRLKVNGLWKMHQRITSV
jgi:hypothetical protein